MQQRNRYGEEILPGNPLIPITHPDFKLFNPLAKKWKKFKFASLLKDQVVLLTLSSILLLTVTIVTL